MLAYLEAKIATKPNLLVSLFSNFPRRHAPRPLEGVHYTSYKSVHCMPVTKN